MPTITKLYNPLDDFNSYSIHYVMLACRSTEDARVFMDEDDAVQKQTLADIESVSLLGEAVPANGKNDVAYLMMDTRRFSQFTIEKLKYETLINGLTKGKSTANLVTTIDMTILDSVGISFINFIQWLLDEKMQCNFDGVIFMLRVVFVGHQPEDGTAEEIVQTITIPMHLLKLELNLDYAKGAYTAQFMPNMNFDAKSNSRWLTIGSASQYRTADNTLGNFVDSLEGELNARSLDFYTKASSLLKQYQQGRDTVVAESQATTPTNSIARGRANEGGKYGRLVKYSITIPTEWRKFTVQGRSTAGSTETIFSKEPGKDSNGKPKDSNMAVESGLIITDVLDRMFRQVPQISDLGAVRRTPGEGGAVEFYKYIVGLSSDSETVIVHVDVIPFKVPNIVANQKAAVTQGDNEYYETTSTGSRIPKQFMEFDYIFTGKNSTILNFDMKLQELQFMLTSNLDVGPGAMTNLTRQGQKEGEKLPVNISAELVTARPYDALLMPKNSKDELDNFSAYSSLVLQSPEGRELIKKRQDYTRNLSSFYGASPITVVMTIKGNPKIMAKFSMGKFLQHDSKSIVLGASAASESSKKEYRDNLKDKILQDNTNDKGTKEVRFEGGVAVMNSLGSDNYATTPVFVKVNIKGPNVDFRTSEMVDGQDFTTEILYDNYYVVFKVTNIIEGGNFTQDLELWSHNVFGTGKLSGPPAKSTPSVASTTAAKPKP